MAVKERNIALAIILSVITCGIYMLFWIYEINEDTNSLANDTDGTSGGIVLLLMIVTCGIYGWYWYYKLGEKGDKINATSGSRNILYLVLAIFGLGIVDLAIQQDILNKASASAS